MATYSDLIVKFPQMQKAIEAKGGKVTIANNNPSPDEIIAGIGTITPAKASYQIVTAELPNVTFTLTKDGTTIATKNTGSGGVVDFIVSEIGTYILSTASWTKTMQIDELPGLINVGAGDLANYTFEQIHTACQGGYAKYMWKPKDQWTYVDSGSIYNNLKIMIAQITTIDGVDNIDWVLSDKLSANYHINPYYAYLGSASGTSWGNRYTTYGGFKYSAMRQRMLAQGEEVYSQATGILPSDYAGTLTDGVKINELYYTDQNGATSEVYTYNDATDNFTAITAPTYDRDLMMFVKGYFKSVGTIDETTFNGGYYYTYNSSDDVYTRATSYTSGTTYYGLYETMQEDGVFLAGLTKIRPYLVRLNRKAHTGDIYKSYLSSFTDYVSLPAVEEITGLYNGLTLPSGKSAKSVYAHNVAGEGEKQDGYDFTTQATGNKYWTRSVYTGLMLAFSVIDKAGNINSDAVITTDGVRPCFRTN